MFCSWFWISLRRLSLRREVKLQAIREYRRACAFGLHQKAIQFQRRSGFGRRPSRRDRCRCHLSRRGRIITDLFRGKLHARSCGNRYRSNRRRAEKRRRARMMTLAIGALIIRGARLIAVDVIVDHRDLHLIRVHMRRMQRIRPGKRRHALASGCRCEQCNDQKEIANKSHGAFPACNQTRNLFPTISSIIPFMLKVRNRPKDRRQKSKCPGKASPSRGIVSQARKFSSGPTDCRSVSSSAARTSSG